jgi:hypothetical protein
LSKTILPSALGTCSRIETMYVSHRSIVTAEMQPICSTVRVSQNPSKLMEVISRYNLFVTWLAVLASPGCSGDRFYGPGVDTKRGDGKNLAPLPHHLRRCADSCWQFVAFLLPSSIGSRYGRANNKTPSSESVVRQTKLRSSLVSRIHGPSARVHSRLREMATFQ